MIGRLWRWLTGRADIAEDDAASPSESDDQGEDGEFAPSRLDASVLEAHGMSTTHEEKELQNIQDKAEMLEDERPDP